MLRDDGLWIAALKRHNVELVTDRSPRSRPTGIVTGDGDEHPTRRDHLRHRLHRQPVPEADEDQGPRRRELHEDVGRRRAGLSRHDHAGLPELLHDLRAQHQHRRQRLDHLLLRVRGALHPGLPEADGRARRPRRWRCARTCTTPSTPRSTRPTPRWPGASPQVTSWYKNDKGRVSQNWPFPLVDYWTATLAPNPADFVFTPQREAA